MTMHWFWERERFARGHNVRVLGLYAPWVRIVKRHLCARRPDAVTTLHRNLKQLLDMTHLGLSPSPTTSSLLAAILPANRSSLLLPPLLMFPLHLPRPALVGEYLVLRHPRRRVVLIIILRNSVDFRL